VPNPPRWDEIAGAHGSTPEAEGFRDRHDAFLARGVAIYGLSTQSAAWQQELVQRLGLPFPILSDEHFRFQEALQLPTFETGGVRYLVRLTLIIADGRIGRLHYPVTDPAGHAAEVLAALT
jgi:peroxiredoxin